MAEAYTVVPLSALRKIIGARMTEAKSTIAHFRLAVDIEIHELLRWREGTNAAHPEERVSLNHCLIKPCAGALIEHPDINVQLLGSEIHRYHKADISVVIAVEGGLAARP